MQSRSFAKFTCQKGSSRADGLSLGFVCGQALEECTNTNSCIRLALNKIGAFYAESDIVTLTISLYDSTGSLLSLERIAHKYSVMVTSIPAKYQEDGCFPHCHTNTVFSQRQTVEKSVVLSECRIILGFLREHADCFNYLETITFVCCHYVNIPDDIDFLLRASPAMTLIQKLDHTGTGPVFDLSEKPGYHGYTPWKYRVSLAIDAGR